MAWSWVSSLRQLVSNAPFQFTQALRQFLVGSEQCAKADERPDDINVHFGGLWRVQHVGSLNRAMLGKGKWQRAGKFEFIEVGAICDHLLLLISCELEPRIIVQTNQVALKRLRQFALRILLFGFRGCFREMPQQEFLLQRREIEALRGFFDGGRIVTALFRQPAQCAPQAFAVGENGVAHGREG